MHARGMEWWNDNGPQSARPSSARPRQTRRRTTHRSPSRHFMHMQCLTMRRLFALFFRSFQTKMLKFK